MLLGVVGIGEVAGGFDDDLRADRFPGQLSGVPLLEHFKRLAADGDAVFAGGDLVRQIAQDGIVFQKVSQSLGIGEIVDRDEFDIAVIERSSEHVPPDASESVDAYLDCHVASENVMRPGKLPDL